MRQRVSVMLVMVTVLPDSLRACWAARRSTALLHLAAAADSVQPGGPDWTGPAALVRAASVSHRHPTGIVALGKGSGAGV